MAKIYVAILLSRKSKRIAYFWWFQTIFGNALIITGTTNEHFVSIEYVKFHSFCVFNVSWKWKWATHSHTVDACRLKYQKLNCVVCTTSHHHRNDEAAGGRWSKWDEVTGYRVAMKTNKTNGDGNYEILMVSVDLHKIGVGRWRRLRLRCRRSIVDVVFQVKSNQRSYVCLRSCLLYDLMLSNMNWLFTRVYLTVHKHDEISLSWSCVCVSSARLSPTIFHSIFIFHMFVVRTASRVSISIFFSSSNTDKSQRARTTVQVLASSSAM